jgi:hypothetical protein
VRRRDCPGTGRRGCHLDTQPGRTFRLPPRWYADVSANLTIANMDFAEFADATDASGTFRGVDGA